jgi:hypothetical protein
VKILRQLNEFWRMKSIMLMARQDPRVLNDPLYLNKAREYYEANSNLADQAFWGNLSDETKLTTIKHLVLQEISEPQQMRMTATLDKAAIYIVLSGSVEVIVFETSACCAFVHFFSSVKIRSEPRWNYSWTRKCLWCSGSRE